MCIEHTYATIHLFTIQVIVCQLEEVDRIYPGPSGARSDACAVVGIHWHPTAYGIHPDPVYRPIDRARSSYFFGIRAGGKFDHAGEFTPQLLKIYVYYYASAFQFSFHARLIVCQVPPRDAKRDKLTSFPLLFYSYGQAGMILTGACLFTYFRVFNFYGIHTIILLTTYFRIH